jgi:hypothetical protein
VRTPCVCRRSFARTSAILMIPPGGGQVFSSSVQ